MSDEKNFSSRVGSAGWEHADASMRLRPEPLSSILPSESPIEARLGDFTTIGDVARDAAMRVHRPVASDGDTKADIRTAYREVTEKSYRERLAMHLKLGDIKAVNPFDRAPYDPTLPTADPADPMWSLNEFEREKALELLGHLIRDRSVSGRTTATLQSPAEHAKESAAKAERQAKVGYFLDEAAESIAAQRGESERWAKGLWQRMEEAGALPHGHELRLTVRDHHTGLVDPRGTGISRSLVVKRHDVNEWLDAQKVGYRWRAQEAELAPRPMQRQAAQEAAILAKLDELGFDAQAVPAAPAGKASPAKQAVRAALGYSVDVMNKAWHRLRTAGRIKDA